MSPHNIRRRRVDALMFMSVAFVLSVTAIWGDLSLRQFSSLLSAVAFGGILYRGIPHWPFMTRLERVLAGIVAGSMIIGAISSYRLDQLNAPASGVIWWTILHRIIIILTCACWPFLVGRLPRKKKDSVMSSRTAD